jgi:antitoxin CptB
MAAGHSMQRLRWRCRRGMLELDLMLRGFLERGYASLDADGRAAFDELLNYADQDLLEFLMGRAQPTDTEVVHVIQAIRDAAGP